jgi:ferredoxin
MKTGPRCQSGFDLALTETDTGFVFEVGSELGGDVVGCCSGVEATAAELESADQARQRAIDQIERQFDASDLPQLLRDNLNHPRWQDVGERCRSCTNCTMVCPTCFCSSVNEVRDLNMDRVERERTWDSCFNPDFSYLGGL